VWTVSIDPSNPSRLLAGGLFMGAGIHTSVDGGAHWAASNSGLPSGGEIDAYALARDPAAPQTVYLASGDGFFKSTNGGATWAPVGGVGLTCPTCVGVMSGGGSTPGLLYVNASYADGLRKTVDGGLTFQAVGPLPSDPIFSLAAHGSDVYVGFYHSGLYRSTDAGATFVTANDGLPADPVIAAVAIDSGAPANLYAVVYSVSGPYVPTVYASTDAGATWAPTAFPDVATDYTPHVLTDDAGGCVLAGSPGTGVWRSCTGSASWTNGTSEAGAAGSIRARNRPRLASTAAVDAREASGAGGTGPEGRRGP